MADVYATLADGGWRNTPIAITKVVFPDGHVDSSWGTPHRVKVLSNGVTAEETSILHENVLSGTATRSAIDCPTAAKTGTTSELVDAWLDGYTPDYSTVVWMGYPNKRVSMTDVHGEPQQGGYLPAEIWHDYMAAVTEGQTCAHSPPPTNRSPTSRSSANSRPPAPSQQSAAKTREEGSAGPSRQRTRPSTAHRGDPGRAAAGAGEAGNTGAGVPPKRPRGAPLRRRRPPPNHSRPAAPAAPTPG